jgi:hypothetical protein
MFNARFLSSMRWRSGSPLNVKTSSSSAPALPARRVACRTTSARGLPDLRHDATLVAAARWREPAFNDVSKTRRSPPGGRSACLAAPQRLLTWISQVLDRLLHNHLSLAP